MILFCVGPDSNHTYAIAINAKLPSIFLSFSHYSKIKLFTQRGFALILLAVAWLPINIKKINNIKKTLLLLSTSPFDFVLYEQQLYIFQMRVHKSCLRLFNLI